MSFAPLAPSTFVVVCLIVTSSSSTSFKMATDANRTALCAVETPALVLGAEELLSGPGPVPGSGPGPGSVPGSPYSGAACRSVPAAVLCSWRCRNLADCVSFNWRNASQQCELFTRPPTKCSSIPDCIHYESKICGERSCGTESLVVTGDNQIVEFFVDGCDMIGGMPNASTWWNADTVSIPTTSEVIGVHLHNDPDGTVGGLLASADTFVTCDTWKVATNFSGRWMDPTLDDSNWRRATQYGANGILPWGHQSRIRADAQWITADVQSQVEVYFRFHVKT